MVVDNEYFALYDNAGDLRRHKEEGNALLPPTYSGLNRSDGRYRQHPEHRSEQCSDE